MLINYFDKFRIDTSEIEEKLNIISFSNAENASYISNMLMKVLKYLFTPIKLDTSNLQSEIPQDLNNIDAIIYFDTILEDKLPEQMAKTKVKTLIIGNHKSHKINDNIECVNIKSFMNLKRKIKKFKNIYIGFNASNIDFSKYYYNRMRSYFLNVLNSINEISIEDFKNDTEKVCTSIILKSDNFNSRYIIDKDKIKFKQMIKFYSKIVELIENHKINEKYLFYTSEDELDETEKSMLNELSTLVQIINIKDKKEKVSKIYDIICDRMHKEAVMLNYCNFIDNKCATMRYTDGFPNSKENGCCSNTYMDKGKNCRYLKEDHSCSICSISCRVFTCKYLQDRGIDHALWQYPLIDCTMGKIKKQRIVFSFFTPKEEMMKKL